LKQTQLLIAEKGFIGLYKGWGMSMVGIAPFIGIKMASYDWLMNMFGPKE